MSVFTVQPHESGLYVRREIPADAYVIGEVSSYSALTVSEGDTVLDCGANIGAMSHRFLQDGAKFVISVEPFPDNVAMVTRNVRQFEQSRYRIYEKAVVGDAHTDEWVELFTPDTNFGMCSVVQHDVEYARITKSIKVRPIAFSSLLSAYEPNVVKVDIEGGEYSFLDDLCALPEHVQRIAIEWHNFAPHLEDGKMYDGFVRGHNSLTGEQGFRQLSYSGAIIPGVHSAMMIVYSR